MIADPKMKREFNQMAAVCILTLMGLSLYNHLKKESMVVADAAPEIFEEIEVEYHPAPPEI